MLDKVKLALRITHNGLDEEIQDIIDAALLDLSIGGVRKIDVEDALIIRAVTIYAKVHLSNGDVEASRLERSYMMIKESLSLCGDYNVLE